jgi:hypothetical protein
MKKYLAGLIFMVFLSAPVALAATGDFSIHSVDDEGSLSNEYVFLQGSPGSTITADVAILNNQDIGITYDFSPLDAEATDEVNGFFALRPRESEQSELGTWGTLSPNKLTVGAGEYEISTLTVTIPNDLEVGTFYWGGVAAIAESAVDEEGGASGIASVIQVGLRVNLEIISPEAHSELEEIVSSGEETTSDSALKSFFLDYSLIILLVLVAAVGFAVYKKHSAGGK